mmetsp:Transcript_16517/g.47916  ORF Transcript_16517/g.47916 Transcript_16517/m.47916 type:complete len:219 (+) Transcript_16517:106-762(+)
MCSLERRVGQLFARLGKIPKALAVLPYRQHRGAIRMKVPARAVLLAMQPVALVPPVVWPQKDAEAGLPVVHVLAGVLAAILPRILAHAMDHAALPLATKHAPVGSDISPDAIDAVASPTALVHGAVSPIVHARTVLLSAPELALEAASLLPTLHTESVLQVVLPLPGVASHPLPVGLVDVDPHAVGHVGSPFTTIDVAIRVGEATHALCAVPVPLALV